MAASSSLFPTPAPLESLHFPDPLVIGVVSDTHVNARGTRRLPQEVVDLFTRFEVGLILHAGDINTGQVLEELSRVAPVLAVRGNNDEALLQRGLPSQVRFSVGDVRVGLLHGHGGRSAKTVVVKEFAGVVDLAVYGHSHHPDIDEVQRTIFFNPGSPTDRGRAQHFGIGIIRVAGGRIEPELILFQRISDLDAIEP